MATPYMTPPDIRARVKVLDDEGKFPDVVLADAIAEFEEIAEDYLGVAYTPRDEVETFVQAGPFASVRLARPRVRSITSVTVDGVLASPTTYVLAGQILRFGTPFAPSSAVSTVTVAVVVSYSHGEDAPTKGLLRACREYVRSVALLGENPAPRDVIAQGAANGTFTRFSSPNKEQGRPTGWTEVDRLLNSLPRLTIPGAG